MAKHESQLAAVGSLEAAGALAPRQDMSDEDQANLRAVGRAEGRVLLEMGLAMRIFERAHRWDRAA